LGVGEARHADGQMDFRTHFCGQIYPSFNRLHLRLRLAFRPLRARQALFYFGIICWYRCFLSVRGFQNISKSIAVLGGRFPFIVHFQAYLVTDHFVLAQCSLPNVGIMLILDRGIRLYGQTSLVLCISIGKHGSYGVVHRREQAGLWECFLKPHREQTRASRDSD